MTVVKCQGAHSDWHTSYKVELGGLKHDGFLKMSNLSSSCFIVATLDAWCCPVSLCTLWTFPHLACAKVRVQKLWNSMPTKASRHFKETLTTV